MSILLEDWEESNILGVAEISGLAIAGYQTNC